MRSVAAVGSLQIDNSSDFHWNISYEILSKIETTSYFNSRTDYAKFMIENPWVAKAKKINTR